MRWLHCSKVLLVNLMTTEQKMARLSSLEGHSSRKSSAPSTFLLLLVVFGAVVGRCNCDASARDGDPLLHSAVLDLHRKFIMSWTPGVYYVTIEIQVEAKGYVGLGFSPSGGMKGADMVLGWVDRKGETHLTDRYATGNDIPVVDDHQDVTLIRGYRNSTHTTLRFKRPWVTCDQLQDVDITADTQRIIFAYGDVLPSPTDIYLPYHISRGMKRLYVKEPRFNAPAPSNDVQFWDVRAPNIPVPEQRSTLYWCSLFKIPEMNGKTHYIANEPLISKASRQFVRHIILYGCHLPNSSLHLEHLLGIKGAECYSPDMPLAWQFCNSPLATWAVGSEGTALPDHVGIPLGEQWTGSTYFMLEVHYDNPNKMLGVVDNSGLRLFHTKKLRENDGGILDVGHPVSPLMVVGPHSKDWAILGQCSSNCTEQALPSSGIQIVGGLLHSNLLGRSLKVQHIRNGTELSPIIQDDHYDFNYQQERVLLGERTLLPKDRLILGCHYDSRDRAGPTFGGLGTQDEMCLAFLLYYPRLPLIRCNSVVDRQAFYRVLGIEETNDLNETVSVKEDIVEMEMKKFKRLLTQQDNLKGSADTSLHDSLRNIIIKKPLALQNQTVFGVLHERSFWTRADVVASLQNLYMTGPFESFCLMRNDTWSSKGKLEQSLSFEPFKPEERCSAIYTRQSN